jgi:hypothetical protein
MVYTGKEHEETKDCQWSQSAIDHPSTTRIQICRIGNLQGPLCSIPVDTPQVALPTVCLAYALEVGKS